MHTQLADVIKIITHLVPGTLFSLLYFYYSTVVVVASRMEHTQLEYIYISLEIYIHAVNYYIHIIHNIYYHL